MRDSALLEIIEIGAVVKDRIGRDDEELMLMGDQIEISLMKRGEGGREKRRDRKKRSFKRRRRVLITQFFTFFDDQFGFDHAWFFLFDFLIKFIKTFQFAFIEIQKSTLFVQFGDWKRITFSDKRSFHQIFYYLCCNQSIFKFEHFK